MKKNLLLILFLIITLNACGSENSIKVAGSSTVYPITLEALSGYFLEIGDVKMNVESTGTGSGFDLFTKLMKDGNIDAKLNVARAYKFGEGVEQNYDKAFKIYKVLSQL